MAVNAIGLAHALTPGARPELDECRESDAAALKSLVGTIAASTFDIPVLEGERPGCGYVRMMGSSSKQVTHNCDVDGPDARVPVEFATAGRRHRAADDLPSRCRVPFDASFFSETNPFQGATS